MGKVVALKIALLVALAATAYASSRVTFETTALDNRSADAKVNHRPADTALAKGATLSDAELVQTHDRPLFSPNRRPFVPKPVVVEQPAVAVEVLVVQQPVIRLRRLALLGTNLGDPIASVLLRNGETEEVRWIRLGEAFDGWILSSVEADQAAFVCAERQGEDCAYRLPLYSEPGGQ